MNEKQWNLLLDVIAGNQTNGLVTGFIIDSPWLPGWYGIPTLDYYASDEKWMKANIKAAETFPDVWFMPGFWSEYGMCTEPSAFGTKCRWEENALPYADKIIRSIGDIANIEKPNPRTDGLLPFVLRRLMLHQAAIEEAGHRVRFAVARGPLNVATFLMGTTEFLMALRTDPEPVAKLLTRIADFSVEWLQLQKECFPSIEGVFILDDIVGFLGDADFRQSALPYLKRVFGCLDVPVRFFHNDAQGLVCAPYLAEIGVNLFNFAFEHSLGEMRQRAGDSVTLLGNIPPRDVLAQGTPEDVAASVEAALESLNDRRRIILSCGGGMPPDVPTENIRAFLLAAR